MRQAVTGCEAGNCAAFFAMDSWAQASVVVGRRCRLRRCGLVHAAVDEVIVFVDVGVGGFFNQANVRPITAKVLKWEIWQVSGQGSGNVRYM